MNKLFQILVKLKFIRLSPNWLQKKMDSNDLDAVAFGLQYGMYNVRVPAVKYLREINTDASIKALVIAVDDPMRKISFIAMESLESMNCSDKILDKIQNRKDYWKQVETQKQNRLKSKRRLFTPERKDRPSRKSFENLKQMLRKPMNSGKWF